MAKSRPLSANDVADWFINRVDRSAIETITLHDILNLVFFAQAWHLANTGRALFQDEIEAWALGPTVPSVFARFENMSATSIPQIETQRVIKGQKLEILEGVAGEYDGYKTRKLRELACVDDGPWAQQRMGLAPEAASDRIIAKSEMKKFYGQKIEKFWA